MSGSKSQNNSAHFQFFKTDTEAGKTPLDLYSFRIPAGFPSPAEDFKENTLDLNDYLIKNKSATFLVKVTGTSMEGAGIFDEDVLIVDRAAEISDGKIVLGVLNGEFTVKRLKKEKERLILLPENSNFKPIEISEETDFKIWGVVTFCLHKL
ncbi:MAG TPA: translesion error-prone DNA polymerase V autoproteolytic subunit [Bacteroidales bacterium]|nr:translesion error-prone DNA polymerase V autoproteolytic subunit [Bacteroidales bacterium]HPE56960.1 translesion error-prone DNA polymerase V autoproteolytic subunit [Bacteroidales bacterium]